MVAIWMNKQNYEFFFTCFWAKGICMSKKTTYLQRQLLPQINVTSHAWKVDVAGGSPKDFYTQMLWSLMTTSSYGTKTWVLATSILSSEEHSFFNHSSRIHDFYIATNKLYILT